MTPTLRKLALAVHLVSSVGWIGAAAAYLALAVAIEASENAELVRAAYLALEVTGWYVIVPLAVASLITGLVMALGTRWGLLRHYWVLFSLALTLGATAFLLLHMPDVSAMADMAQRADDNELDRLGGDLVHPAVGLVVLLIVQVLNVFKPRGTTRYGQRKQHEHRRPRPREQQPRPDGQAPVPTQSTPVSHAVPTKH